MKATDLRLGNLIENPQGEIIQVTIPSLAAIAEGVGDYKGIPLTIALFRDTLGWQSKTNKLLTPMEIEPVIEKEFIDFFDSFSAEIFVRFATMKTKSISSGQWKLEQTFEVYMHNWFPRCSVGKLDYTFAYLHELQNVFYALTRNELITKSMGVYSRNPSYESTLYKPVP